MPLDFRRSWSDEAVERFRDSWVRFVESEMQPNDAEARRRGHVGHELWRRAGELGFLCVDIPEQWFLAGLVVVGARPTPPSGRAASR
jgi:acyl-CoA dehydrogenase